MKIVERMTLVLLSGLILTVGIFAQEGSKTESSLEQVKYIEMTNSEKDRFIKNEANKMLGLFRKVKGDEVTEKSIERIKIYIDRYMRRNSGRNSEDTSCRFGDDLSNVLKRGNSVAPIVNEMFSKQDLPSQIGLYLGMIESEFCPCLQSPTGSLGMYQLVYSVAREYGLDVEKGASPSKPDERCEPEKASQAAAVYFNDLLNDTFGRNSLGFPLSIAAYNAGSGATKKNMRFGQDTLNTKDISFWLMSDIILESNENTAEGEEINVSKQFLQENVKYVPKFFAAAIIGENPRKFGFEMLPLSQVK